ncbi:hypothetical protein PQ478_09005 [Alkalihalophilus pseudofirmus]|uniref:hypothetical protein n=1 Tax=Alkalihalophilus pseudofirmus TaxID=79885 RepID=UPI00259B298E|nr:hypothetical protein [Alkalihalophilus pseudofirmus]WEG18609.1 hypothetical protein PQ478_09005 [Alkalihalophilus pseudofirmus]
MKIEIGKRKYIETDSIGYLIKEYTGKQDKKTGKDLYTIIGSYGTLDHAIKGAFKHLVHLSDAEILEQLQKDIEKVKEKLTKIYTM